MGINLSMAKKYAENVKAGSCSDSVSYNGTDSAKFLKTGQTVIVFSVIHFLVDLTCIFMLTAFLIPALPDRAAWLWCVLLYNMFAFAFQLPVGAFSDRLRKPEILSAAGCCLIAVSFFMTWAPLAASVTAGLGNACFHIGGGAAVLGISRRKAALSGIYVSTGAFGVYLAPQLSVKGLGFYSGVQFVAAFLMILCAEVLICRYIRRFRSSGAEYADAGINSGAEYVDAGMDSRALDVNTGMDVKVSDVSENIHNSGSPIKVFIVFAVACLALTVCLRSYVGTIFNFQWKSDGLLGLFFTAGIVFGKMAGGIIGDRLGWMKTSVVSLCISALLFLFAGEIPACGIAGVFLFNMTMPVTLTALANVYEKNHGFVFGITTFALFIGVLPSLLGLKADIFSSSDMWLIICVLVSAVVLAGGLFCYTRVELERVVNCKMCDDMELSDCLNNQ